MNQAELMCTYLNFDGNCEEALNLYGKLLGGTIDFSMRFEGTPAEAHVPEHWRKKIMHAQLNMGKWALMACDAPPGMYKKPQGMHVQVTVGSVAEAEHLYGGLSDGANIEMKLERTFWAERFGMLTDRFGTPWMINCQGDVK